LLHVAKSGVYSLQCRFESEPIAGTAVLKAGTVTSEVALPANAKGCSFSDVRLEQGAIALEVVLTHGDKNRGVHQADLFYHAEGE
jgi:hypothetical protein